MITTSWLGINTLIILIPFVVFLLSVIHLLKVYFLRREHLLKAATVVFVAVFLATIFKIVVSVGLGRDNWHIFAWSSAIGLLAACFVIGYFVILNFILKKKYLDIEDMLILVSGALISGWPNIIIFLSLTFLFTVFRIFYLFYIKREVRRIPLTGALIVSAFLTLLSGDYLMQIWQIIF